MHLVICHVGCYDISSSVSVEARTSLRGVRPVQMYLFLDIQDELRFGKFGDVVVSSSWHLTYTASLRKIRSA